MNVNELRDGINQTTRYVCICMYECHGMYVCMYEIVMHIRYTAKKKSFCPFGIPKRYT